MKDLHKEPGLSGDEGDDGSGDDDDGGGVGGEGGGNYMEARKAWEANRAS